MSVYVTFTDAEYGGAHWKSPPPVEKGPKARTEVLNPEGTEPDTGTLTARKSEGIVRVTNTSETPVRISIGDAPDVDGENVRVVLGATTETFSCLAGNRVSAAVLQE